ncbi:MAG TPA: tryptophan synthase subunit alpha [Alphaproteobacteria bacterium]|nr:tryptophan synthase subunit alpha [Alphaproteobacteria bacterium]
MSRLSKSTSAAAAKPAENRIAKRFAALKSAGRAGLVTFITAGDPDRATSQALLAGLPAAGADLIELGMPFSDPMADGPAIQAAGQRALKAGAGLKQTLAMVAEFRASEGATPLILMGYYNPIFRYGPSAFIRDAAQAGVDGLIIVDLPPEEDAELRPLAEAACIAVIRLVAPTTSEARAQTLLSEASGFVYYVSVTGVTGTRSAARDQVAQALARLRQHTALPLAVGFGIKTPEDAAAFARDADAVVVGSALVQVIADRLDAKGKATPALVPDALDFVRRLARGVAAARATTQAAS